MIQRLQQLLYRIREFLGINKLRTSETKAMILISTSTKFKLSQIKLDEYSLKLDAESLEWVSEMKYLFCWLMTVWALKSIGSTYIRAKISKKLYFFSRISTHLSMFARTTVFRTIIQPHFDYCASLLYLMDQNSYQRLQVLYNRGIGTILRCNRYTPIQTMLDCLNWFPVRKTWPFLAMTYI